MYEKVQNRCFIFYAVQTFDLLYYRLRIPLQVFIFSSISVIVRTVLVFNKSQGNKKLVGSLRCKQMDLI